MRNEIDDIGVFFAPSEIRDAGLLAWARVSVAGVRIDGLAVRRSLRDDRLSVTWPMRRAANGELHSIVAIVDDARRSRVEGAVMAAYFDAARRAGRNPR